MWEVSPGLVAADLRLSAANLTAHLLRSRGVTCSCLYPLMRVCPAKKTNGPWAQLGEHGKAPDLSEGRPRDGIPLCALFLENLYATCP